MKDQLCDLSSCFLCLHCIPAWKEAVAVKKKTILFKKGELLFKETDPVNGIFFLNSGAVKVHKHWVGQKELIIRFARKGDILGHRGLASEKLYPVSATALTECKACFITNSFLETSLQADHQFTYQLMQFYFSELQKAEVRMRNLAHMDVKGRIAEALLELKDVFGVNKDGHIAVSVSRQDIAAYSGTTYETVFKLLRILTNDKTISTSGKNIKINDGKKLQMIVKLARYA